MEVLGKLPKGLKLSKSRVIAGTVRAKAKSGSFTIEVLDHKVGKPKHQDNATKAFTITIS